MVVSQGLKNELALDARECVPNQALDTCLFDAENPNDVDRRMGRRSDVSLAARFGISTSTNFGAMPLQPRKQGPSTWLTIP